MESTNSDLRELLCIFKHELLEIYGNDVLKHTLLNLLQNYSTPNLHMVRIATAQTFTDNLDLFISIDTNIRELSRCKALIKKNLGVFTQQCRFSARPLFDYCGTHLKSKRTLER